MRWTNWRGPGGVQRLSGKGASQSEYWKAWVDGDAAKAAWWDSLWHSLPSSATNSWAAYTGTPPLLVANGGTGAQTFTAHGVLIGEGTGAIVREAVGTNGQMFLGATGADPGWQTMGGDATLGTTGTMTLATVNGAGGSCTLCSITSNAKGLITSFSSGAATIPTVATATGTSPITITATNLLTTIVSMATPAASTINLADRCSDGGIARVR